SHSAHLSRGPARVGGPRIVASRASGVLACLESRVLGRSRALSSWSGVRTRGSGRGRGITGSGRGATVKGANPPPGTDGAEVPLRSLSGPPAVDSDRVGRCPAPLLLDLRADSFPGDEPDRAEKARRRQRLRFGLAVAPPPDAERLVHRLPLRGHGPGDHLVDPEVRDLPPDLVPAGTKSVAAFE